MRCRLALLLLLTAPAALLSACGSAGATAPPVVTSVAGTWDLTTVNGASLPFILQRSDPKLELMSKQYVVTDAGTFTYSFILRETTLEGTVGTFPRTDTGTDVLANNEVTFRYTSDGTTNVGTVSGNTMTLIAGSATQIFIKR